VIPSYQRAESPMIRPISLILLCAFLAACNSDSPTVLPSGVPSSLTVAPVGLYLPTSLVADVGGTQSRVYAISSNGIMAGYRVSGGLEQAWVRDLAGQVTILPPLVAGRAAIAKGVNASGIVVGEAYNAVIGPLAVYWDAAGAIHELGTLGNVFGTSSAQAINDAGVIVGSSRAPNGGFSAYRWDAQSGMQALSVPASVCCGAATGSSISPNGTIAGYAVTTVDQTPAWRAVVWPADGSPSFVIPTPDGFPMLAHGVNDAQMVVGLHSSPTNSTRAFIWTPAGGVQDITADGGDANGVNTDGAVVGFANNNRAFLWSAQHGLGLLPTTAGSAAYAISPTGVIVGYNNGVRGAFWRPSDVTPPTIAANVAGSLGENGWYVSDVTVSWTTIDPESGVSSTTGCGTTVVTTDNSGTSYTCSATDGVGLSASASVDVKRDATAPVIAYSGNAGTYTVDQTVSITCAASDATSGLASTTCVDISSPAYVIGTGIHSYTADATDNAGNTASASATFTISVTPASLCALSRSFVTNARIAQSLCAKLEAAERSAARGSPQAKDGLYGAYIAEVNAQSGKSLTAAQASILAVLAASL
jgi:hypothetical protein